MSTHLQISNNNIIIPFGKKTTCRTLSDVNVDDFNWKKIDISYSGDFNNFEVYYSQDHPDYNIIVN